MKKETKARATSQKRDIRSIDIPWWIGGPKVIATPARTAKKTAATTA